MSGRKPCAATGAGVGITRTDNYQNTENVGDQQEEHIRYSERQPLFRIPIPIQQQGDGGLTPEFRGN